jgi:hypothetical protein
MTDRLAPPLPEPGDLWNYPYLWAWQAERGEEEGRKRRPCAVALAVRKHQGQMEVILLPVTSQQPPAERSHVEVPEIERKRAGLDEMIRLWVICDEFNADLPEQSFYFEPRARLGAFSRSFTKILQSALAEAIRNRRAITINRR